MDAQPQPRGRRTWSAFGNVRKMPSEYEIVSHDTNYTVRNGRNAALEQNSSSPMNLWFLTYRDKSPLQIDDWQTWRDPDEVTYRRYVTIQDEQESASNRLLDRYSDSGHDKQLSPGWRATMARLFTPTRYPAHAVQLAHAYLGHLAPAGYITNSAAFAAADMLRRASMVAYRTRELQIAWPDSGFGTAERSIWESDPAWQGTRKALELALTAYDWGECFTAVNLVLRPTLDDILLRQLGEVARNNGDEQAWLLLANLDVDAQRLRRWSTSLARHAVAQRADNVQVFKRWVDRWTPHAEAAAAGLATLLADLPEKGRPAQETIVAARQAREQVLAATR
jgi:toluene monooxygenase system protein E